VFTKPDQRNRGHGTRVSSSVVGTLLAMGIRTIVLNVAKTNHPAIRSYTRIGFLPYCKYQEGLGNLTA
jgi:predicted GNAT family acetyltransferase